jgi:hypothetical protein
MKTYRVWQQEIWDTYTLIEAEDSASAIRRVKDGEGDMVHSEYNRQADFEPEAEPESRSKQ